MRFGNFDFALSCIFCCCVVIVYFGVWGFLDLCWLGFLYFLKTHNVRFGNFDFALLSVFSVV